MTTVFAHLQPADYAFLAEVIRSPVNLTDDAQLDHLVARLEASPDDPEVSADVQRAFEQEIRYLGSADIAYMLRYVSGKEPGVTFREIIYDVAKRMKVNISRLGTDEELLRELVTEYATREFAKLTPEEQQQLLVDLGVDKDKAARFVLKSAGVFALPLMIQAFNAIVIEGLIKRVILGTIARFLGETVARRIFLLIAGRFPWWVGWIGPVAWAGSIGWTALDLQGPASRKTIPAVLYLGLCGLRQDSAVRTN